jgi:hypothetical protein
MSAWSDFLKDYCAKTGVTYTVASKDPEVKILYKEWKASIVDLEIVEEEAKVAIEEEVEEAIAATIEEELLEKVKEEFKDENAVALGAEQIALIIAPPAATPIFISKKKRKI